MHYEADENELMNLVRSVNNHMNHVLNQFYSPYGLTRPQAIVLSEIERNGPVTVSLLAHRLGMTTSNLCLIAQRLEYTDPENMDKIMEGLRLLNAVMMKQNQGDKACD